MLASTPASILNHKPRFNGIPFRFNQAVKRSSPTSGPKVHLRVPPWRLLPLWPPLTFQSRPKTGGAADVLAKQFSTTPAYAEALGVSKAGMRRVFTTLQGSERVPRSPSR